MSSFNDPPFAMKKPTAIPAPGLLKLAHEILIQIATYLRPQGRLDDKEGYSDYMSHFDPDKTVVDENRKAYTSETHVLTCLAPLASGSRRSRKKFYIRTSHCCSASTRLHAHPLLFHFCAHWLSALNLTSVWSILRFEYGKANMSPRGIRTLPQ